MCSGNSSATKSRLSNLVEVELIIAVDVSGSITNEEYELQKDGVILAFRSPEFINYLRNNKYGISVLYMEWSDINAQVYTKWHRIHTIDDSLHFIADVSNISRHGMIGGTSISSAMYKADTLFTMNPYPGIRKVLDVSGDGKNSSSENGTALTSLIEARNYLIDKGVTINGLPIMVDSGFNDLDAYYKEYVIGGSRSFSMVANSFEEFASVFLRKLLAEIS